MDERDARASRDHGPRGLTASEAGRRLERYGPNVVRPRQSSALATFGKQLWGPVPWMLEASLLLEIALGKGIEGGIIVALLVFNAALSFRQEHRARAALELLRQRLQVDARILRDGSWQTLPAQTIVPGDVLHLRVGDLVPADLRSFEGSLSIDQSTLTGESMPVDRAAGDTVYSGSMVVRGEASGIVTATGASTYFGRTAELVRVAEARGQIDAVVLPIVRYLSIIDAAFALAILAYSLAARLPVLDILPFILILLVTAVPVALPAAFTVTTALAALKLADRQVLATRLAAIESAAGMDVLCTDKTGTLTQNRLRIAELAAYPPYTEGQLLMLAGLASDRSTQDPFDLAILERAPRNGEAARRQTFIPFDPTTKRSEARALLDGNIINVMKGAPATIAALTKANDHLAADVQRLATSGARVLAIAAGRPSEERIAGLLAFSDPPRTDAKEVIHALKARGITVRMVTGDTAATANSVAAALGIEDVAAGVFPEEKFRIVRILQDEGHIVGMTGDGVNDAPALRQADVGVAVANATDVAKAAASLVLTIPGLAGLIAAVDTGRGVYQRLLTWTLNKVVKALQAALLLTLGFFLTGGAMIMTPRLMLLMLFANDFVTLSLASDRVRISQFPDRWRMRSLLLSALPLTLVWTLFSLGVFFFGQHWLGLKLPALQTLTFVTLIFTGQATVYLVRERGPFWRSVPGRWVIVSTAADVVAVSILALKGLLMAPLSLPVLAGLLVAVTVLLLPVDALKIAAFARLGIR